MAEMALPPKVEAALAHVAVGCNAAASALSGRHSLRHGRQQLMGDLEARARATGDVWAAFGAKNAVALLEKRGTRALRVAATLQHRLPTQEPTRITSTYLFSSDSDGEKSALFVLAGDSEGRVFLWRDAQAADAWRMTLLSPPPGGKAALPAVSVAAAVMTETHERWVCVASFSDGTIAVFTQPKHEEASDAWTVATTNLGVRIIIEALDTTVVAAADAQGSSRRRETVLLAAGGVDRKVHLFELAQHATDLTPLVALFGHQDWVRSVAFQLPRYEVADPVGSITLASGSQDQRVRLWEIRVATRMSKSDAGAEDSLAHSAADSTARGQDLAYAVRFDALLLGHEDWVTSLQWTSLPDDAGGRNSTLVSSSMDNTLILWECKEEQGSWSPSHVVGTVGGNGLLAVAMLPSVSGEGSEVGGRVDILALNLMGQLERWRQQTQPASLFLPAASVNGHCGAVTDLSWSPSGELLMSVSLDQTTRIIARSLRDWHEISRAQVHGYDINCGCFVQRPEQAGDGINQGSDRIVSGADEKILRVFDAPDEVYKTAAALRASGTDDAGDSGARSAADADSSAKSVRHAYLPELSLTNKSATNEQHELNGSAQQGYAPLTDDDGNALSSAMVPVGDTLYRKTLWPEQRKLYGHGNELLCVASNHAGTIIASACKSREERFAAVWLWNTSNWSAAQEPVGGHKSSVVQLAFSPDDQYLLSVSKDRQFCVYTLQSDGTYALQDRQKAHKRIIWSCSWSPDSQMFVIGSRDQSFSIWRKTPGQPKFTLGRMIGEGDAVTAVAFAPRAFGNQLLAVGLESGVCQLYSVSAGDTVDCVAVGFVPLDVAPSSSISRLAWSPTITTDAAEDGNASVQRLTLAAGSSDHSVRVYNITWRGQSAA